MCGEYFVHRAEARKVGIVFIQRMLYKENIPTVQNRYCARVSKPQSESRGLLPLKLGLTNRLSRVALYSGLQRQRFISV